MLVTLSLLLVTKGSYAFTVHKKDGSEAGPTLLVFGGIQGDEPGGFMAANLLLTHYTITRGHIWIVPNLNFASIIARSRGVYGDMNRKFATLDRSDPEYPLIKQIKSLIRAPEVNGVINLHDGSGFYRSQYIDHKHNSLRWGQSTIIDQAKLPGVPYGKLASIANGVCKQVNAHLLDTEHRYSLKNTRTREGDVEMAKTLSFYAINQGKPAFAIEASKSLGTAKRVYYHLLATEAYLKAFGIEFKRELTLTPAGVAAAIDAQPQIALYDHRLVLDVADARHLLNYVPMRMGSKVKYEASSPLVALVALKDGYRVSYGNNHQTLLQPQFMAFDDSLDSIEIIQHGRKTRTPFGNIVSVTDKVSLQVPEGYRVNLIGYTNSSHYNEANLAVSRKDFIRRFSVDRAGHLYRAEVYRKGRFCGMVLLDFSGLDRNANLQWRYSGQAFYAGSNALSPRLAANPHDEMNGR